jgi:hypothetical protein
MLPPKICVHDHMRSMHARDPHQQSSRFCIYLVEIYGMSSIGSNKVPTIMDGACLVDLQPHILPDFTWVKWGCFRMLQHYFNRKNTSHNPSQKTRTIGITFSFQKVDDSCFFSSWGFSNHLDPPARCDSLENVMPSLYNSYVVSPKTMPRNHPLCHGMLRIASTSGAIKYWSSNSQYHGQLDQIQGWYCHQSSVLLWA